MMNYILPAMFLISFVSAVMTGKMNELSSAIVSGGASAVELLINLVAMLCLWGGIMEIAEKCGITEIFSKITSPFIKLIFPSLKKEKHALEAVSMNISANILGMGNAATPLGIEAMKRLQLINPDTSKASDEMVVFVVMNTAAMRLIPTTVAMLRSQHGSEDPMAIMLPTLFTTMCATIFAVTFAKIGCRISKIGSLRKCLRK